MAVEIRNRLEQIEKETALYNEAYANSNNAKEKFGLEKQMERLTTEYLSLASQLVTMV